MILLKNEAKQGIEICNKDLYKGTAIKGVLFDMDGVILDTEKLYTRFWREAAKFFGYDMSLEMALGMRSLNRELGEQKLKEYFGPFVDYQFVRNKRIHLMEMYISENGLDLKPGIYELLDFLQENELNTAVATASPLDRTRYYLAMVDLLDEFDKLVSAHMVKKGKPEPDIYIYAAAQLGLKPEECLVLEDSPTGLMAAYRAGCVPVMVPDQDQPDEEVKTRVYAVADSLEAVINLMEVIEEPEEDTEENEVIEEQK